MIPNRMGGQSADIRREAGRQFDRRPPCASADTIARMKFARVMARREAQLVRVTGSS